MPLDDFVAMLSDGDRLRVAEDGEMYPNFEVWLASNGLEREALSTAITAEVDEHEISISSIELQIAYKLRLAKGGGTTNCKDFEDALRWISAAGSRVLPRGRRDSTGRRVTSPPRSRP
ncbi:hypothetical protein ACFR97_16880 [Haloplanus litoreus]